MEQLDHSHFQFGVCDKWLALQMFVDFNTHLFIFFNKYLLSTHWAFYEALGTQQEIRRIRSIGLMEPTFQGVCGEWGEQGRQKSKQINKDDERL